MHISVVAQWRFKNFRFLQCLPMISREEVRILSKELFMKLVFIEKYFKFFLYYIYDGHGWDVPIMSIR
jgi:hypothetical protein